MKISKRNTYNLTSDRSAAIFRNIYNNTKLPSKQDLPRTHSKHPRISKDLAGTGIVLNK